MKRFPFPAVIAVTIFIIFLSSCDKEKNGISPLTTTDISDQYNVSTIAGSGAKGSIDGPAATAQFDAPIAAAVDAQGNVYVTESGKYSIRKITKDGTVSTLAGGSKGVADGSGTDAQFILLGRPAVDAQGNIYVTDSTRIRKISPIGSVTTLAGGLSAGHVDGNGTAAQFSFLGDITIDKQGNIYVLDLDSGLTNIGYALRSFQIRKITPDGMVSTFIDKAQKFDGNPYGIGSDASGNIFLRLRHYLDEDVVYKITPSKSISQFARASVYLGSFTVNSSTGEIFITSWQLGWSSTYSKILKITPAGQYLIAGGIDGFADGAGNVARFSDPNGLSADEQGNIYVADLYNNRIRKISKK
jgi:sugar lactone lactonase YvrE